MLSDASADSFLKTCWQKKIIAQDEQFLLLSPCFQLYSIIVLSFKGSFQFCSCWFSNSAECCRIVVCGKELKQIYRRISVQPLLYHMLISCSIYCGQFLIRCSTSCGQFLIRCPIYCGQFLIRCSIYCGQFLIRCFIYYGQFLIRCSIYC